MKISVVTIEEIILEINRKYFLPALQREYVWSTDQICALFDSLMQGYPISTFLFWKIPRDSADLIERYNFLKTINSKNNKPIKSEIYQGSNEVVYVLDGQQRLTSLYVGLMGTFVEKRNSPKTLHFDILHNFELAGDEGDNVKYKFEFRDAQGYRSATESKPAEYWVSVQYVYERKNIDVVKEEIYKDIPLDFSRNEIKKKIADVNLERLHRVIFDEQTLAFHTEYGSDEAKMLDIFMRANNGGTALTKADLLMSTLTLHWDRSNSAGDEIRGLVDKLNDEMSGGGKKVFKKDFVLKACLVLLGKQVAYDLSSYTKKSCLDISKNWDKLTKALEVTIKLIKSFGVNSTSLLSVNALMPIAYFVYKQNKMIVDFHEPDTKEAKIRYRNIQVWLYGALLNGIFSGSSDLMIHQLRIALDNSNCEDGHFNVIALDEAVKKSREVPIATDATIDAILETVGYGDKGKCFLALSILYPRKPWDYNKCSIEHLFPQDSFNKMGLEEKRQCHDIANLALTSTPKNSSKNNMKLIDWLADKDDDYLVEHYIPRDKDLWSIGRYQDFLSARRVLLRVGFKKALGVSD